MNETEQTMAQRIAEAAATFQQLRTGLEPKSVSAVLGGDTLVVTLQGGLSPAEFATSQTPEGAAKIQEFHRQLFLDASYSLREEIKRITGLGVCEVVAEVEPASGTVVHVFTSGTMVQGFLLSGKVPTESFETATKV